MQGDQSEVITLSKREMMAMWIRQVNDEDGNKWTESVKSIMEQKF